MASPARDPTPEDEGDVHPLESTCTRWATWNITQQRLSNTHIFRKGSKKGLERPVIECVTNKGKEKSQDAKGTETIL